MTEGFRNPASWLNIIIPLAKSTFGLHTVRFCKLMSSTSKHLRLLLIAVFLKPNSASWKIT